MRIAAMAAMAVLASVALQAKSPFQVVDSTQVTVCMQSLADFRLTMQAQGIASKTFAGIGVKIAWHDMSGCPAQGIRISLSERAPASFHPGAMAYAMPYEGAHIVLFYDRIAMSGRALLPHLMAHVMVHEITHILQGIDRHSEEGVMKAQWGLEDFNRMMGRSLDFTDGDVEMIHNGLLARAARQNAAETVTIASR
jgi:hypothetical protein